MKTPIVLYYSVLILLPILIGCNESAEKSGKEKTEISEEENSRYLQDMENYKLKTTLTIERNSLQIAKMKEAASQENKNMKVKNLAALDKIERQNNNVKVKMDDYSEDGPASWYAFKARFGSDMKTLENSLALLAEKTTYLND